VSAWSGLYDRTLTIRRATRASSTRSAAGTVTWSDHLTDVAGAVQPLRAAEIERYARLSPTLEAAAYVDACDVLPRDRLLDGGTQYEIAAVLDQAGRGEVYRLLLARPVED